MAINGSVQYNGGASPRHSTVDPLLLPSNRNPFKCHDEVLSLQPIMIPPNVLTFSPLTTIILGDDAQEVKMRSDFSQQRTVHARKVIVPVVVVVDVIPFILDVWLVDVPAGVTQEEGHTGFLHLPSAM